jgi:hypothetical protein
MLPASSTATPVGFGTPARVAGPPSPETFADPFPATVVMTPVRAQFADAVAAPLGDVDVAPFIDGDGMRTIEVVGDHRRLSSQASPLVLRSVNRFVPRVVMNPVPASTFRIEFIPKSAM